MILTCPQCKTKFSLPDAVLGEEGKTVKCSVCAHKWFQEPAAAVEESEDSPLIEDSPIADEDHLDEMAAEAEKELDAPVFGPEQLEKPDDDLDDLPDTLKSASFKDEAVEEQSAEGRGFTFKLPPTLLKHPVAVAAGCAALIFVAILGVLVLVKKPVVKMIPAMNGLYSLLGAPVPLEGRNIVFNNLKVEKNGPTLHITGDLVNLSGNESPVLPMMAVQMDEHKNIIKQWLITPPVDRLAGGEITAFESEYPLENNAVYFKIGFSLEDMTDSEVHDTGHEGHNGSGKKSHSDNEGHHGEPKATSEHAPAPTDHHNPPAH